MRKTNWHILSAYLTLLDAEVVVLAIAISGNTYITYSRSLNRKQQTPGAPPFNPEQSQVLTSPLDP